MLFRSRGEERRGEERKNKISRSLLSTYLKMWVVLMPMCKWLLVQTLPWAARQSHIMLSLTA